MAQRSFRHSWIVTLLLAAAFCLLVLASPGWGSDTSVPEITLKEVLQGKGYSLSQFRGKVVVINFFTFYCEPCREEMPDLNQINEELKGKGLPTLGIALSSDPAQIRFLLKQLGLEYPVLIGDNRVSDAYRSIPWCRPRSSSTSKATSPRESKARARKARSRS